MPTVEPLVFFVVPSVFPLNLNSYLRFIFCPLFCAPASFPTALRIPLYFFSPFFHAVPATFMSCQSCVLSFLSPRYFPYGIDLFLYFFAPLSSRFANSSPVGSIALGFPEKKSASRSRSVPHELFPSLFSLLFFSSHDGLCQLRFGLPYF